MRRSLYFLPTGYPVTYIQGHAWQGLAVEAAVDGDPHTPGGEDFPEMEFWPNDAEAIVGDGEGDEFLLPHCRIVEVYDDFDQYVEGVPSVEPWPEHIVKACRTACAMVDLLGHFTQFIRFLPRDWANDSTLAVVFKQFITGRANDTRAAAEAEIAEFRKNRVEVVRLKDPDEETEDA